MSDGMFTVASGSHLPPLPVGERVGVRGKVKQKPLTFRLRQGFGGQVILSPEGRGNNKEIFTPCSPHRHSTFLIDTNITASPVRCHPQKFTFLTVFLLFFLLLTPNSQLLTNSYAATTNFSKTEKIEIAPARKTLRVGEKFVYGVYWMGINVGEGTLEVKELITMNGKEAYHIIGTAKSNDFLSAFYKVEDIVHSYIDKKNLCALKFEKHQREGRYKSDEITIFDQERHKGYYESLLNKKKKEFDIPHKVHDIPSAFYYFRTLDVKPNSKVTLDVNADEKNWKLDLNVIDTQQLEILHKGVHKVFCVEPKAPFKGVISKRSKAWVYFSVDENRVPLFIKIRIPFGFVVGVLEKAE